MPRKVKRTTLVREHVACVLNAPFSSKPEVLSCKIPYMYLVRYFFKYLFLWCALKLDFQVDIYYFFSKVVPST